jgi:molybdopterin molybdotransferase
MSRDLISVAEAEALIAEHMPSFGVERVTLGAAVGRVLREPVYAERDHPPFDRVMMDGIGIRWSQPLPDSFAPVGTQLAGAARQTLQGAGTCLEVTTGAVVPEGCDCIIPVEQTRRRGDRYVLADGYRPAKGQFIHPRGSDCRAGTRVLDSGVRLGPPEMAQLAANGVAQVEVAASPSIAIVATGDELVGVDALLAEGQIRRSNDMAIAAALRGHGFDRTALSHVTDDLAATIDALQALLAAHEVVIISGGVSMGQKDYVPQALSALGVQRVFHRIAQRPGKPMWFGVGPGGQVVFALPGNPVSSLVCFVRYVRPALLAAMGMGPDAPYYVRLDSDVETSQALTCFVPVRMQQDSSGCSMAHPALSRTSGDFSSLTRAHGVVQLPAGQALVPAGAVAVLYRW